MFNCNIILIYLHRGFTDYYIQPFGHLGIGHIIIRMNKYKISSRRQYKLCVNSLKSYDITNVPNRLYFYIVIRINKQNNASVIL